MTCPLLQTGCVPLSHILNEDADSTALVLVSSNRTGKNYPKWGPDREWKDMTLKGFQSVDKILKCHFLGKNEFVARE